MPLEFRSFENILVLCEYDIQIRQLIHLLKYNRFTKVTFHLAELAKEVNIIKTFYDYIIPVPLHKVKLRERGYNQSAELAKNLAREFNLCYAADILQRERYTGSQTRLSREERLANVNNAFRCDVSLDGKSILVVDDVITTGSTVEACASVLKASGAKRVDVFALANPSLRESQLLV